MRNHFQKMRRMRHNASSVLHNNNYKYAPIAKIFIDYFLLLYYNKFNIIL